MDDAEALETVRGLLPGINWANLFFDEVHASRRGVDDGDDVETGEVPADPGVGTFTMNIELQRVDPRSVAFRLSMEVVRSDVRFDVAAVSQMLSAADIQEDEAVDRVLASRVAIPFAFPYLRAKIHQLSLDMNVPPVILGLVDPASARLLPTDADEQERSTKIP